MKSDIKVIELIREFIMILFIGVFLTLILTWPFITKASIYFTDSGDYAFASSMLYYNQQSIKSGLIFNQKKYFNGYQFYPQPNTVAYADHLFLPSLIYSPIYWFTNNYILSVNLLTLFTFVLSFLAGYYVLNILIENKLAASMGAFVYTFNPQMFARFPVHLDLLNHFFLPLVFLFAYKFLTKPSFKNIFLFSLTFTLNSLTSVYFQIMTIIFLPIFAIPFSISNFLKKNKKYFIKLFISIFFSLIFIPILLYFNSPYLNFSKNEQASRKLEETLYFSSRLINWFFSSPNNFIYGDIVRKFEPMRSPGIDSINGQFNYAEHTLFLNITPIILFIFGLLYFIKQFKKKVIEKQKLILGIAFLLTLVASFILSFGPVLFGWNGEGPYWKMPYFYLYQICSIFQGIRVPSRFQFIFYLPFAFFVSYGVFYLMDKVKNIYLFYSLIVILASCLIIENINITSYDNKSTTIINLNKNIEKTNFLNGKNVLHLPIHIPELGETSTYTLNWYFLTNTKSLNGYSGYAPKDQIAFLVKIKEKFDEEALKQLKIINTDYVIIHKILLNEEAEKYEKFSDLYRKGTIYEDNELQIIDLNKYNFVFKICNYEEDFDKDIKMGTVNNNLSQIYVLVLKNKSDCYLPSIYEAKYKIIKFNTNFIAPSEHMASFKLPPIIGPFENIILSEITNNLKISDI